ncbi:nucleoside deaminase, partial [Mycolicibacterium mucogenicum]|uniref:nucleoside deaminase n=1 Tax=Mycolicibacterium mucogenicum TaxID=56689 RepID=UPI002E124AEB
MHGSVLAYSVADFIPSSPSARQGGGAPYGALVADAAGNVVSEHGNTSSIDGGDPTDHAEMVTVRSAWRALGDDGMKSATLYASTEPCTMCA